MSHAHWAVETQSTDLPVVKAWIDSGDYENAGKVLSAFLTDNPNDEAAWFLMGRLLLAQDNPALARVVYEWTTARGGKERWQDWLNLGTAWDHLNEPEKAEQCYKTALKLEPDNQNALVSLGTCYVQQYRSLDAINTLNKALELYPDAKKAVSSLGFAHLQMRHWGEGWDCYESGYGKLRWRMERQYSGEGRWLGVKKKSQHVLVHGEQGIGDQIAGVEPLNDMIRDTTVVALEVSPKVEKLFARSFPIEVHGTLHKQGIEWPNSKQIDSHTGLFTVHKHYRRTEEDYSGKPYLVADPVRRIQWRALLDSLGPEPKIGIAWSGGVALTKRQTRRANLSQWLPILKQKAHWICLEYKDRTDDIDALQRHRKIVIHDWPWATQTDDYDDTAALVAELDLVICVPTSVVHLAGALGVPTWCMVHPAPNIHYCGQGDRIAYYGDTVRLFRRGDEWAKTVHIIAKELEGWISARKAA